MKRYILGLLSLFFVFYNFINVNNSIIDILNKSKFKPIEANINTYAILNNPLINLQQLKSYFKFVEAKIGIVADNDLITIDDKQNLEIKQSYKTQNVKLTINLKTINSANTYLIVDTTIYNNYNNTILAKAKLENIFKALNLDSNTNLSITGYYEGNLDYEQKKSVAANIMTKAEAKFKQDYVTDRIYSVIGYTKLINEYIYKERQKININLALRYNNYENRTYLYLATPIITTEY